MFNRLIDRLSNFIFYGINGSMEDREFLEESIRRWKDSPERKMQIKGQLYYLNEHDILHTQRTAIGVDGNAEPVKNLPNNHVIDNQYRKLVDQKSNYLLGQPIVVSDENETYVDLLKDIFDKSFMRLLKRTGEYALNGGIGWIHPCYDENGDFIFRVFPSYEILPFWADADHTRLNGAVRLYLVAGFDKNVPVIIEKAEIFDDTGIHKYILDGGKLLPDVSEERIDRPYVTFTDADGSEEDYNWEKIPLVPFKCNSQEVPLLKKVKSLQDGLNRMLTTFQNNMEEDSRNTILVLKNYEGTDLGEFRHNLSTYGAIKIRYDDTAKGGVETLHIEVNAENYDAIIRLFKKAIIENGMGYDAKDDKLSGNPNQMNIQSMYSDIDLDANNMETEFQAGFSDLLWFVNMHLINTGQGDFSNETPTIIFNRDMMMDESSIITNLKNCVGILSNRTIVEQMPFVDDVEEELRRIEEEKQEQFDAGYFGRPEPKEDDDE